MTGLVFHWRSYPAGSADADMDARFETPLQVWYDTAVALGCDLLICVTQEADLCPPPALPGTDFHFVSSLSCALEVQPHAEVVYLEEPRAVPPGVPWGGFLSPRFKHPASAFYVVGPDPRGLDLRSVVLDERHCIVTISLPRTRALRGLTAATVVLYDRWTKIGRA